MKHISYLLVLLLALTSCQKEEGKGGNASIHGNINVRKFNSTFTNLIGEYPAADHYVYIIYGDDISYGNRIKTDYEGDFEFKYLYKGTYQIYTYSLDSTLSSIDPFVPVIRNVTISNTNETIDLGTINIYE